MGRKHQHYSTEFRAEAVRLAWLGRRPRLLPGGEPPNNLGRVPADHVIHRKASRDRVRLVSVAGTPLTDALARAASAARDGAQHTRELRARVGRAGWLADRSKGAEDAGAHLVALIAQAASRYVSATSRGDS
jgi:hypothetical protein